MSQQTFIVGQSSGGYAALWLPLHYPKIFGGSWAVSPDPVDFSNFTGVDLYSTKPNIYKAADGSDIPFFIKDGKPLSTLQKAIAIESFEGDGGQWQSFEAAFGKPDKAGRPKQLFNRQTGAVNKVVLKEWESYDLGKFLLREWSNLRGDLSGKKLHVYAGANDNFLLHQSVEALREKVQKVNADIVVELFDSADHFNMWTAAFTSRIQKEMDELASGQKPVQ
jgi:S-formylglutathione hydrolase FrmB